ncbi:MAG: sensor histidine kinase, partial [Angelakisella sp.]
MKKIFNALLNLQIRWKLFICYLFAAILPLTLVIGITFYQTQNLLRTQSYDNMCGNLRQINNNITESLGSYYHIIDIITVNKYIEDYLAIDYSNTGYEDMYFFIDSFLKSIMLTNPYIDNITIFSENLTLPEDNYYFHLVNPKGTDAQPGWYQRMRNTRGETLYGGYRDKSGDGSFSIVRNMTWHNPAVPTAILSMQISERQIKVGIDKLGSSGSYYIVDPDGIIIFATDTALSGTNISNRLDTSMLADLRQQTAILEGERCIVTSLGMENGWRTIATMPEHKFFEAARQSAATVLVIFLFFSAFAMGLIYLVSYALSQKAKELTWAVNEMRAGNLGVSIPITTDDEIGQLTAAFNEMSVTIKKLVNEVYEKELSLKQSELNMLQEQVRPHFLYNALSSISSLALRNQDEETCEMVHLLSDFYRISLNQGRSTLTLRDELALTKCYIDIQKVRFRDKILVEFAVDESLLDCQVLKLILQPILENSINHGLGEQNKVLTIRVTVAGQDNYIRMVVEDNGQGIDPETLLALRKDLSDRREGFGLKNVNVRIKLSYSDSYGLWVDSSLGE